MLAYCLAFGTILAKVGRVYHIFNNPTERKKVTHRCDSMTLLDVINSLIETLDRLAPGGNCGSYHWSGCAGDHTGMVHSSTEIHTYTPARW